MENGEEVTLPLYIVVGTRGERMVIGEAVFQKRNDVIEGTITFKEETSVVEAALHYGRSVTNQA